MSKHKSETAALGEAAAGTRRKRTGKSLFVPEYNTKLSPKNLQFRDDLAEMRAKIVELEQQALRLRLKAEKADGVAMECELAARTLRMAVFAIEQRRGNHA